jgi:CRP-like cAMP-binding protein
MLTEALCIIAAGSAQVLLDAKKDLVVAELTAGDCFGEMATLCVGELELAL